MKWKFGTSVFFKQHQVEIKSSNWVNIQWFPRDLHKHTVLDFPKLSRKLLNGSEEDAIAEQLVPSRPTKCS